MNGCRTEPIAVQRPILCVVAPHSGCGKTLFVCHLLRHVPGLGCLKISPRPSKRPETGTSTGKRGFWFDEPGELRTADKDTSRYLEAGAARVERLLHEDGFLAAGLTTALKRFPPDMPLVVESASAVQYLPTNAVVMVVRAPVPELKAATQAILPRVTDLLINTSADVPNDTAGCFERFWPALQADFVWRADLGAEPPPAAMLRRIGDLLGSAPVVAPRRPT